MSTDMLLAVGGLAILGLLGLVLALLRSNARSEVLQELRKREVDVAKKQSTVMAEHRTAADTTTRLRDGSF